MIELTGRKYAAPWTDDDRYILSRVPGFFLDTDRRDAETILNWVSEPGSGPTSLVRLAAESKQRRP